MLMNIHLTLEQGFAQVHINVTFFLFSINTCTVSICSWECTDKEEKLFALIYAILYRRFEHPWILVSVPGVLEPISSRYQETTKLQGSQMLYPDLTAQGSVPLIFMLFKRQLYIILPEHCLVQIKQGIGIGSESQTWLFGSCVPFSCFISTCFP